MGTIIDIAVGSIINLIIGSNSNVMAETNSPQEFKIICSFYSPPFT